MSRAARVEWHVSAVERCGDLALEPMLRSIQQPIPFLGGCAMMLEAVGPTARSEWGKRFDVYASAYRRTDGLFKTRR